MFQTTRMQASCYHQERNYVLRTSNLATMKWSLNAGVLAFFLHGFFYIAESSLLPTIKVGLHDSVTLPFNISCDTGNFEWRHRQETRPEMIEVAKLNRGAITAGLTFENRVKRGDVNFYLTITSVVFNDNGWFQSYCNDELLQEVKLEVFVPNKKSTHVGENVTLSCHGSTNKCTKDSELYIQWKTCGQNVLNVMAGNVTHGDGFEDRVSVSMDGYRRGDLTLTLTDVQRSDQGTYLCFFGPDTDRQRGNPEGVALTVTPKVEEKPWT